MHSEQPDVVEQRRQLVLDPRSGRKVARALEALTIAPERFISDKVVYLGLRTAYWRLKRNPDRAAIAATVDQQAEAKTDDKTDDKTEEKADDKTGEKTDKPARPRARYPALVRAFRAGRAVQGTVEKVIKVAT